MKKHFHLFLLPILFVFSSVVHSMSIPAVQNLQISNDTLQWNEVADAGGYNVYYFAGGPSKFEITFDYLSTVKGATSFTGLQPGLYRVIAFNADATVFGEVSSASSIWLREDGSVDDSNFADNNGDDSNVVDNNVADIDNVTITFFGSNNERYIVENQCVEDGAGFCEASCNAEGNQGFATGGYCSSSEPHINASGGEDYYSCSNPEFEGVIIVGAYCSK